MSAIDLPFDASTLLKGMRPWVECESPTWDADAVSRMAALAAAHLQAMGAATRTIPGTVGHGDNVFASFDPDDQRPGILILCHIDTVHPLGTLQGALPFRVDGERAYGPGLFDMKSGTYIALAAVAALRQAGVRPKLPVRVLLTSDEESGSRSTRALIEATAANERCVLVPEGAQPNGNIVSGRYPSMRLQVWTRGRPAHALLQKAEGRSALLGMARMIGRIEALNGGDVSFTATLMQSGRAIASVPLEAYAEVICTAATQEALDAVRPRLEAIAAEEGVDVTVAHKSNRPIWTPTPADGVLADLARGLMRDIGIAAEVEMIYGGSDGNFTGGLGVPTLDGLGPVGADAHQLTESIDVASLVPRARLLAGLLANIN